MSNESPELKAILHESDQVHQSMQRLYNAIYAGVGAVLPGALAVFLFIGKELKDPLKIDVVAFAFLAVYCLGSIWLHSLWSELFVFVRYKYLVLYPRLYAISGQTDRKNFLQAVSPRTLVSWLPTILLQLAGLALISAVWIRYLLEAPMGLKYLSLGFILATIVSGLSIHWIVGRLQKEMRSGPGVIEGTAANQPIERTASRHSSA